jgi:hypothetical protein
LSPRCRSKAGKVRVSVCLSTTIVLFSGGLSSRGAVRFSFILFVRLVASSAIVAAAHFDIPNGPLNTYACQALTSHGDHIFAEQKRVAEEADEVPPLLARIPSHFKRALALAYANIHLVDDQALVLSYMNCTSPFYYTDDAKIYQAMLLLPSFELINYERDRASSEIAQNWARSHQLI